MRWMRLKAEDTLLIEAAALFGLALGLLQEAQRLGVLGTSLRWQAAIGWSGCTGLLLPGLWAWLRRAGRQRLGFLAYLAGRTRWLGVAWTALWPLMLALLVWHPVYGGYFRGTGMHLALWILGALPGAWWLAAAWPQTGFWRWLGGIVPYQAALYALVWFVTPVSRYPLSQGWSETSRYYYASLFFSPRLYGFRAAWPALHPSRYLLQALPFLFGRPPLWVHRAWQAGLWVGLTLAAAWAVTRRLQTASRGPRWGFFWGAVLFLLQAPVYYHLLVMVVLVVWGADFRHPRRTWVVLLLASVWAGISRVNWFPVPAVLMAMLYFLEVRQGGRAWWRYWLPALTWGVVGTGVALAAQALYAALSGNPPQDFGTSFTSDLLWYRLLPSPTFPQGVLPMALIAGLPAVALIAWGTRRARLPWTRWLPLAGLSAGLWAGGLLVSVKIGGGNNLHNLDAWFVSLLLWGGAIFWGTVATERQAVPRPPWGWIPLLLALPLTLALSHGAPHSRPSLSLAREVINAIRQETQAAAARGEAVLFISERHLLTQGEIEAPLIPDYERTFLMEMAMAHNQPYLEQFRADLAAHRFGLIVVQPLNLTLKGSAFAFGEENDAWVEEISRPLLCYYEPLQVWRKVSVQLMKPRQGPGEACR